MRPPCIVDGCDRPAGTKLVMCGMHHSRKHRTGTVESARPMRPHGSVQALLRTAAESTTDECIIFPRAAGGTMTVSLNGAPMIAARAVWTLANGDPGDLFVLHTCNYGSGANGCINPRHLRLGTQGDNVSDMWGDPRVGWDWPRGENHHSAKLTEQDVRDIRASTESTYELGRRYGVHPTTVSYARAGKTWTHI